MENKNSNYNKVGTSYMGIPTAEDSKAKGAKARRRLAAAKSARKKQPSPSPPPPPPSAKQAELPAPGQLTKQGRMYVGVPDGTGRILRECGKRFSFLKLC